MSTFPAAAEVSPLRVTGVAGYRAQHAAGLAALLAVLGLTTIWSTVNALWALWTTDALKSIGMFIPLVSFVLILRVWRSLGWEMEGNWWGLIILAVTAGVVHLREQSILVFVLSPTTVYAVDVDIKPDKELLARLDRGVTHLALVKQRYQNIRANVLYARLDPKGRGRIQISAELPLIYATGRHPVLPDVHFPVEANDALKPERHRQSKLEPQRFLQSLPVYRYRVE